MGRGAVDAVIVITPYEGGELLARLRELGLPVVLCGQLEGDPYRGVFSSVYSDDVEGAALAAQALVDAGRREVICVMGPAGNPASADRLRGYRRVLGERMGADRVIHTGWDQLNGHRAMRELLEAGIRFDAVLAGSDRIAIGAIEALREAGRDVPGDVSVIGFDDRSHSGSYHLKSLPVLTQIIKRPGKAVRSSFPGDPQRRPPSLPPRRTNDPQRGCGFFERNDTRHRSPVVGDNERTALTHRAEHSAGFVAQFALRQAHDLRPDFTHDPRV